MLDKLNQLTESHGELKAGRGMVSGVIALSLAILCFLGVGGIFLATYLRFLAKNALRPLHDPRIDEAVMFQNI